jgi:hypothetical protein
LEERWVLSLALKSPKMMMGWWAARALMKGGDSSTDLSLFSCSANRVEEDEDDDVLDRLGSGGMYTFTTNNKEAEAEAAADEEAAKVSWRASR